MFTKILIANRGEIACRVAATARRFSVRTVAVYSDADADARHVRACDEAVRVGESAARDSYLRAERIVTAALATGAQAVHPGYGFLSENAAFAQACADAGLVFIGPPPAAIAAMGNKSAAKALMEKAGVPLVPGYHGSDNDAGFLAGQAARIGYPVLIKASSGGGGKGMRRVDRSEDFAAALAACQREAQSSFGDASVLVERYVTRPRHIEIQVFADAHGRCIHLFERDCSVQRRHQKVLEESPAPGLCARQRAEMGAAAVAAARAVGYVGAGTVEFIAEPGDDASGSELRFYFMEMNTRLQVEHPVTEAVTGLDLVEWQLRVAAGEPLPLAQEAISMRGHAIEARICAENPDADFLPSTGTLHVVRWPAHVEFERHDSLPRVDSGVREGDAITPHYDPMIAKLIVWGENRAQALARLDAALRDSHLMGPATNVAFLRSVVASRAFASADLDTALITREHAALFEAAPLAPEIAAAAVLAHVLAADAQQEDADPWSRRDGWRVVGEAQRGLALRLGDRLLAVRLSRARGGSMQLHVDGATHDFAARPLGDGQHDLLLAGRRLAVSVYAHGRRFAVFSDPGQALLTEIDPLANTAAAAGVDGRLTAPMPGRVIGFLAAAGERVRRGQALAVMEAMKIEHTLHAPRDGVVAALLYAVGDQVAEGGELLRLAAEGQ
jgi:3-methylcrotonyl-CoA carboxylase alpha subunit